MSTWDFVRDPSSIRLLVNYGEQHGVSAATLLRRTGLHKEQLQDPNVEVQATQELLVIANLIKALKNPPLLGLDVGLQYGFTTYGIWGYGLISSATVGDALSLALRFMPLTYAFTQISTTHLDEQIVIKFAPPGGGRARSDLSGSAGPGCRHAPHCRLDGATGSTHEPEAVYSSPQCGTNPRHAPWPAWLSL